MDNLTLPNPPGDQDSLFRISPRLQRVAEYGQYPQHLPKRVPDTPSKRLHPLVGKLNFERLKWKLSCSTEAKISIADCELAEQEYRRYLSLIKFYPGKKLVPNKLVDEFWHAHILDTVAYHSDCQTVFGAYLHHFPYFGIFGDEDYNNLVDGFAKTKALYERHFGEYPSKLNSASRCEDHPCHAPSECACRAPGTCK